MQFYIILTFESRQRILTFISMLFQLVPAEVKDIRTEIKFDDTAQYSIYNTFIQVTWEEAESDYPIIEYEVKWRRENSDFKTLKVTGQTFCNFKGHSILRRSPSLNFTVKAISKVGAGPESEEVYFKIPIGKILCLYIHVHVYIAIKDVYYII